MNIVTDNEVEITGIVMRTRYGLLNEYILGLLCHMKLIIAVALLAEEGVVVYIDDKRAFIATEKRIFYKYGHRFPVLGHRIKANE